MDFTLTIYQKLLESFKKQNYQFQTVEEYFTLNRSSASSQSRPLVIMRHDVDRKPQNALRMAKLENELGVKATYYFRTIPQTFKPVIIKEIAELGHEIGYHYECLSKTHGDYELALDNFYQNLNQLRRFYPIKTISMHGKALSKWDNRDLWKKYDYKQYNVIGEPYFDLDFSKVLYLTDTGQRWDGSKYSIRDKPFGDNFLKHEYKRTSNIIQSIKIRKFPSKVMFNIHPERWNDNKLNWIYYQLEQNIKRNIKFCINLIKRYK